MKLDTLLRVFARSRRVRLHLQMPDGCLTVVARNPVRHGDELELQIELGLGFDRRRGGLLDEGDLPARLRVNANSVFTRRIQTHRRHLEGLQVPEDYFRRARSLGEPMA